MFQQFLASDLCYMSLQRTIPAWFGFNWCGSFVEYMDSLQQPARQHQGGMQSHYNMSHDYFLCKRGGYTAGIKISGRPVANASNICVGRHIIRIIVAQLAIAQFN